MKIQRIETIPIRVPLRQTYRGSRYRSCLPEAVEISWSNRRSTSAILTDHGRVAAGGRDGVELRCEEVSSRGGTNRGSLRAAVSQGTCADTIHEDQNPIWSHMIANRPAVKDGWITLSDRSGLGWELDEEFIGKYRISYGGA